MLALLLVARHLPRIADVRLQAGDPGGSQRHAEQPPQRLHLADHVQHAVDRQQRYRRATASIAPAWALSQSYSTLTDSLWYPPATVGNSSATVTPYDSNNLEVPRAMGGTCYSMGLMLAYNQFSGNSALQLQHGVSHVRLTPAAAAAWAHRRSLSSRPTVRRTRPLQATFRQQRSVQLLLQGPLQQASPSTSEYPSNVNGYNDNDPTVVTQIMTLVNQLAALSSAQGYSTPSRSRCCCIALPSVRRSLRRASARSARCRLRGNVNDGMPSYKIINGNASTYRQICNRHSPPSFRTESKSR